MIFPTPHGYVQHSDWRFDPLHRRNLPINGLELNTEKSRVQEGQVNWICFVFVDLEPVACGVVHTQPTDCGFMFKCIEYRKLRSLIRRTHIRENNAAPALDWISTLTDLLSDRAVRRLSGCIENSAVHIELPTVVATTNSPLDNLSKLE